MVKPMPTIPGEIIVAVIRNLPKNTGKRLAYEQA
jgi:hypothetical protein